ncbi:DUF4270 domain-containing protein [Spongiivirga citrea]|uniref:DUF4270 family protein n=1 Tax=Spongiivirga citrea TaxID=1481457 RepID=A0A6M0CGV1_9FLAO|nr:DUF4270 domain-containing protein [Spongiivirga citrea]NER17101.1 DUF4270 family protein [Spongiivirga citrea]
MKRLVNAGSAFFTFTLILAFAGSCTQEFNTIGADVIGGGDFNVEQTVIDDIFLTNTKLGPVRSNFLPLYQLGSREDAIFGRRTASVAAQLRLVSANGTNYNPTFGNFTQDVEDTNAADGDDLTLADNERVVNAYLDIPFFSTVVSTEDEENTYELDSLFGNRDATFNMKVEELTFFLRSLDPDNNFQQVQQYYTSIGMTGDGNPTPNFADFTGTVLFDGVTSISDEEIDVINVQPDDEGNPVTDERLSPRIRVPLDSLFIQERILNAEGTSVLSTDSEFTDYLRGIYITTSNVDNLLMLLDFANANIRIEYEFDEVDTNNTVDDPSDDTIVVDQDTFLIPLNGNVINILEDDPLPITISDALANTDAPENLFIRGGQGIMTEVKLFDEGESSDVLDQIKANNWLINQANLIFYVDEAASANTTLPNRLYLYDLENETALFDYLIDPTSSSAASERDESRSVYGGILDETADDGPLYRFSITSHLSNIIRRDSTNVKLGLSLTSDINNINVSRPLLDSDISTPEAAVISPFGVVLHGNSPTVPENKRTKLEVFFSEID